MQQHPLDLPEVLTLIGSFLPMWVENPKEVHRPTHILEPKTITACLRVSKLWYKTLLPVLWYTYSSLDDVMAEIPAPIIRRNSHLCRILEVPKYALHKVDLSLFACTHLVEATISHDEYRQGAGNDTAGRGGGGGGGGEVEVDGQQPQQQLMEELSSGQRLLRSNPQLKRLDWTVSGQLGPALDAEDFAGLMELETLLLSYWVCSNGQLSRLLGMVAQSLKELKMTWIIGVQPEELSSSLSSSREGEDTGVANGDDAEWTLSRLEVLEWFSFELDGSYLSNLVKRCPNLKSFKIRVALDEASSTRLANSLRTHCPNLEALNLGTTSPIPYLETLIKYGPTPSVLRKLEINCEGPDCGLIAAILHHASTLEDMSIARRLGEGMDAAGYCRLLFECPRLTRFAFSTRLSDFNQDYMDTLKEQRWACRGLQELRFSIIPEVERTEDVEREMTEEDAAVLYKMGWEYGNLDACRRPNVYPFDRVLSTKLWKALEVVQDQDLEQLRLLQLDYINYRKISFTRS